MGLIPMSEVESSFHLLRFTWTEIREGRAPSRIRELGRQEWQVSTAASPWRRGSLAREASGIEELDTDRQTEADREGGRNQNLSATGYRWPVLWPLGLLGGN